MGGFFLTQFNIRDQTDKRTKYNAFYIISPLSKTKNWLSMNQNWNHHSPSNHITSFASRTIIKVAYKGFVTTTNTLGSNNQLPWLMFIVKSLHPTSVFTFYPLTRLSRWMIRWHSCQNLCFLVLDFTNLISKRNIVFPKLFDLDY